jgi:hypothetical protein
MEAPTDHWVETLTGLGATGVEVVLGVPGPRPTQGHPLVPVLQVALPVAGGLAPGFDLALRNDASAWVGQMLGLIGETLSRRYQPAALTQRIVDFQMTRGQLGISV